MLYGLQNLLKHQAVMLSRRHAARPMATVAYASFIGFEQSVSLCICCERPRATLILRSFSLRPLARRGNMSLGCPKFLNPWKGCVNCAKKDELCQGRLLPNWNTCKDEGRPRTFSEQTRSSFASSVGHRQPLACTVDSTLDY